MPSRRLLVALAAVLIIYISIEGACANHNDSSIIFTGDEGITFSVPDDLEAAERRTRDEEMQSLLYWGIQNSDPQRLKELTEDQAFADKLQDAEWLLQRRKEIKETMDFMQQANPSETDLMVESIGALNGTSIGLKERLGELKKMVHMVEPIDNANDLPTMGGLVPVMASLAPEAPCQALQCAASDIIRIASSNNPTFVQRLLERYPGAIRTLTARAQKIGLARPFSEADWSAAGLAEGEEDFEPDCDVAWKALGALANVIRAEPMALDRFLLEEKGARIVAGLLVKDKGPSKRLGTPPEPWPRFKLRAVDLAGDIAELGGLAAMDLMERRVYGSGLMSALEEAASSIPVPPRRIDADWSVPGLDELERSLRAARSLLTARERDNVHGVLSDYEGVGRAHKALVHAVKALKSARNKGADVGDAATLGEETRAALKRVLDMREDDVRPLL